MWGKYIGGQRQSTSGCCANSSDSLISPKRAGFLGSRIIEGVIFVHYLSGNIKLYIRWQHKARVAILRDGRKVSWLRTHCGRSTRIQLSEPTYTSRRTCYLCFGKIRERYDDYPGKCRLSKQHWCYLKKFILTRWKRTKWVSTWYLRTINIIINKTNTLILYL